MIFQCARDIFSSLITKRHAFKLTGQHCSRFSVFQLHIKLLLQSWPIECCLLLKACVKNGLIAREILRCYRRKASSSRSCKSEVSRRCGQAFHTTARRTQASRFGLRQKA
ncbi:unnamed protein product [Aphanomyces euteiches]